MMKSPVLLAWTLSASLLASGSVAGDTGGKRTNIDPEGLTKPSVFNHVVTTRGGTLVHIAGQTARGSDGNLVGRGDKRAQMKQVLERLQTALASAGASFDNVIRQNIYVVDMQQEDVEMVRAALAEIYPGENKPTSTLLGVSALAEADYLIEIDMTAHLP